jgi:hypothetical protein
MAFDVLERMDSDVPPIDSRPAAEPRQRSSAISLWLLALLASLWMMVTGCACGWTTWYTTIGVLPIFYFASQIFVRVRRVSRIEQTLAAIALAIIFGVLLKNVVDMITGHP